ncbi:MAG: Gfo/Idh/MocA family oxidoreductase [Anaerolineae bacterium]|nr:Gfo/Idh/MocA family oxidoreductase [Anaerolineae bacterium]
MEDKPLRVAVVGSDMAMRAQVPGFMAYSETNVVTLCSKDKTRAQNAAIQFGVRAVYDNYQQMLDEVRPDLVSIAVPLHQRHEVAIAALNAGAHIICESPLALDAQQAAAMLRIAEAAQRVHVVNFAARYLPGIYYHAVLAEQGYVGEIRMVEATHFSSAMRGVEDWDWRSDAALGGGVINKFAPRYIDAIHNLLGDVVEVTATSDIFVKERYLPASLSRQTVTAEDAATLSMKMAGGQRATLALSAVMPGMHQRFALYGDRGVLVLEDDRSLSGSQQGWLLSHIAPPMEYRPPVWDSADLLLGPFVRLVQLTVDAIRYGQQDNLPTFADGLRVQRVLDAAHESTQTGRRGTVKDR